MLVSRFRVAGAAVAAGATCAMLVLVASQAGAVPASIPHQASGTSIAKTGLTLASVGSDSAAALGPSSQSAIAENGRYVAFTSDSALKVSATAPRQNVKFCNQEGLSCVYVRDLIGHSTTLLGSGGESAATISATGRLVGYQTDTSREDNTIFAVNRQATGHGAFDAPGNLVVHQVTDTPNDLTYERIPFCPQGFGDGGATRTTPCGPKLSANGTTLVYPAQLSPISPDLTLTTLADTDSGFAPIDGNTVDLAEDFGGTEQPTTEIIYTLNSGSAPITFGTPAVTGPFTIGPPPAGDNSLPECKDITLSFATELSPGACGIEVTANGGSTCVNQAMLGGTVFTGAALPAGQTAVAVTADCTTQTDAAPVPTSPPGACPAPPSGLPLMETPPAEADYLGNGDGDSLLSLSTGATSGEPFVAWAVVGANTTAPPASGSTGTVEFQNPTCAMQLVNPASLHLANPFPAAASPPPPCTQGETLTAGSATSECVAYLLVDPGAAATDLASLTVNWQSDGTFRDVEDVAVTGVSNVVIARHDLSGKGNFAASPSTVVSVTGKGKHIPGASEASVSATGRYVAFTAPVPAGQPGMQVGGSTSVWVHDTDAKGNSTFKTGPTELVSCLPKSGACTQAPNAESPSLSGNGTRVAFATMPAVVLETQTAPVNPTPAATPLIALRRPKSGRGRSAAAVSPDQVDARNITTGKTVVVSTTAAGTGGDGISYAPAMSEDGSTVAFISDAGNLTSAAVPVNATNLFVRTLAFGPVPSTELAATNGTSLPANDDIALPAIDAHGRIVTFQTSVRLLPAASADAESVYAFERFPDLAFSPHPVSFGTMGVGKTVRTVTVTVTDSGPGPATITGVSTTAPFGVTSGTCHGVLYTGTSCQIVEQLTPRLAGNDTGTATVATTDDDEPTANWTVPVSALVLKAQLSLTPDVDVAGQVTVVVGTGFVVGQKVTLTWSQGLGTATVTVTASGSSGSGGFTQPMVIFPDDVYGPRMLLAKDSTTGQLLATAPFLAQVPSAEPPFTPSRGGQ